MLKGRKISRALQGFLYHRALSLLQLLNLLLVFFELMFEVNFVNDVDVFSNWQRDIPALVRRQVLEYLLDDLAVVGSNDRQTEPLLLKSSGLQSYLLFLVVILGLFDVWVLERTMKLMFCLILRPLSVNVGALRIAQILQVLAAHLEQVLKVYLAASQMLLTRQVSRLFY